MFRITSMRSRQIAVRIRLPGRLLRTKAVGGESVNKLPPAGSPLLLPHRPPLAVRVGIIGTSVGLATPLFATVGVARLWSAYLPRSPTGTAVKYAVGVVIGGGSITLIFNYIVPFLRDHSDFVLPFALANGIASSFWYLVGEAVFGLDAMTGTFNLKGLAAMIPKLSTAKVITHFPSGGIVIGALTAATAPFLWPIAFDLCWDDNTRHLLLDNDKLWLSDLYQYIVLPIGIPTGVLAGISMHLALKPAMLGIPGTPWQRFSLPVLGALVSAAGIYFTWCRSPSHDFMWEQRVDVKSGNFISHNPITGETFKDDSKAVNANLQRAFSKVVHTVRRPLHGWFAKGEISTKKKVARSVQGLPITVNVVDERTALFHIVDILVRWRYLQEQLQVQNKKSSSSNEDDDHPHPSVTIQNEIKKLDKRAKEELGITDLARLTKDVEVALIALRHTTATDTTQDNSNTSTSSSSSAGGATTNKAPANNPSETPDTKRKAALKLLKDAKVRIVGAAEQSSFATLEDRSHCVYVLEMLTENLPVLEDLLQKEAGYRVAVGDDETKFILSDYRARKRSENIALAVQRAVLITSIGALSTGVYYFFSKN